MTVILVLGIIWAFASIGMAIVYLAIGGLVFEFPLAAAVIAGIGVAFLIGGILAILSCYYIYKLEQHNRAFILCLIGSIIALITGFFGLLYLGAIIGVIGIVFAFLINKESNRFSS